MAKRRNSPALFELLRDQSGNTAAVGTHQDPGPAAAVATPPAPAAAPLAPAAAPPAPAVPESPADEPAREAEPLSDAPAMEITTPRFVAQQAKVAPGEPDMPDLSDIEPEPMVSRADDGRVRFSIPVGTLAGIIGAAVIGLVVFGSILYSAGGNDSKQELQPILGDQANRALENPDPEPSTTPAAEPPVREPIRQTEVTLTPEPETVAPVVDDPPADSDADPESAAATAVQDPEPDQPSNIDTRQPGLNYMYTSMTFDQGEAERAQQFLFDNGIDSIVEEMTRRSDGRKAYRLWTLVGIPGEGFNTSREKFNHESAIFELGNLWLTEHGGRLDFSRQGQIGWIKYGG